jgi:hypothetical protein
MMIFKRAIPRRTFVRGLGTTIALPLLDAMIPAFAYAADTTKKSPIRVAFVYLANGRIMDKWTPATTGSDFRLPATLEPLARFRDRLLVLTGLAHRNAESLEPDEAGGFHPRASAAFLTAAHPKRTEGADLHAGISLDQVIAQEFGKQTQLASLELAVDSTDILGGCDTGYACAYSNTLCWRGPSTPIPMENRPRMVFERLFGDTDSTDRATRLTRMQEDRSILDFVKESVDRLLMELGSSDRTKLTEYLDAVRDIERRIQIAETQSSQELPRIGRPVGVPAKYSEHAKLLFDLEALAFRADLTRVASFMMGREQGTRVFDELGISDPHHGLSHHQNDAAKIAQVAGIDRLQTNVFAEFLATLESTPDGEGSLLDHTVIVYGGGISDGNLHLHHDLPVVLIAGRASGIEGGRHLRYPERTPMANLYVTMLDRLGFEMERFGDSTGSLKL